MAARHLAIVVAASLAGVGVLADYFLKRASDHAASARTGWFWLGLVVYAAMAGGWVYVMRHLSFAELGIVYSATTLLLLTGVGVVVLGETLRGSEALGVAMALGAIALLGRFG